MKFSVLLPTRNRLEYLRYAIETVRRQDYEDWELIVSDNFSEDDIAGYVLSLNDARIIYVRTDRLVPVTDNWNNALRHSRGDYVVMLGDDDGLLPDYFSTLMRTFRTFPDPDFVYVSAYFFAYPGAVPAEPDGFLRRDRNSLFTSTQPFWLDARTARQITRDYLDFRMPVASNMQFSLMSRRTIERLSRDGSFFRSPFPDFYATPLLFLRCERILVQSQPMVVVGITRKSYGASHFSDRASEGATFLLNNQQLESASARLIMLPGTSYNDSWLLAMEALRANTSEIKGTLPNYRRYRFRQIVHNYKRRYFDRTRSAEDIHALRLKMSALEIALYGLALPFGFAMLRRFPKELRDRMIIALRRFFGQHTTEGGPSKRYENLLQVYESLDADRIAQNA